MKRWMTTLAGIALTVPAIGVLAQNIAQMAVDTTVKVSEVSPKLYGLMTEEINFSYDGGLYAEMIRNRTFTNRWPRFEFWRRTSNGDGGVTWSGDDNDGPSKALPKSMKLVVAEASPGNEAGITNDGFWGMAVRPSTIYRGSFYAKPDNANTAIAKLIDDSTGSTLAEAKVPLMADGWKRYSFTFKTGPKVIVGKANHFELLFEHPGTIKLQLISLFPPTYNNREYGNRPDLMKLLAGMHPNFLRFPGGNYVEGNNMAERFNWKETVGPLVDRPTHRTSWRYLSSDGMGLLEFLEWCEDLKMEPVLAIFAGYTLDGQHVEGKDLEPFVQDALDEIEYVTGDPSSKWGGMRARDGHPEPFKLRYVEIGNEDFFDKSGSYDRRFAQFSEKIRKKYPDLKLIATTPVKGTKPDLVDDHYYRQPQEFFEMIHHYDGMDRKGPKIFVGEWATRTGSPTPDFGAALGDAAWMTSMERNSDLIVMAAYAPLFTNVNPDGMQWSTDLIGYNALKSYGSASYWAQVLFAEHLGDHTVKSDVEGVNKTFFWSATVSDNKKMLYLKLVNASDKSQALNLDITDAKAGPASLNSLHAATWFVTNSIDHPAITEPVKKQIAVASKDWRHTVGPNTIEVIDIPLK